MLQGVKVLLEGPSGTGKTYAMASLVEWCAAHGIEVFVLFTENGLETLLGAWADSGKAVPANLHWHVQGTKPLGLGDLIKSANNIGKLTYESLTKMNDPNRAQNNAFEGILTSCNNFKDDRTEKEFGPVDSWGTDKFFFIDSLSELANACMKMQIGNKPTAAPPDYMVAQNSLINFLRLCTQGCACHFGLTAHVSREKDEMTGGIKLMTSAIGSAISGQIPQLFSDTIFTVREGDQFYWDTATTMVDVKTRNLPIRAKIKPDFGQIMEKWAARAESAK